LLKNEVRDGVRESRGNWESIRLRLEAVLISNKGQVEWSTIRVCERDDSLLLTRVTRLRDNDAIASFYIKVVGTIFLLDTVISENRDEFIRVSNAWGSIATCRRGISLLSEYFFT